MTISKEKQQIIKTPGNVLITANPGTGKTYLLAAKYISLIKKDNLNPEDILCLTFTIKAKQEMEERIIAFLEEEGLNINISKMNIHTFHSFALDNIEAEEVSSSNLLRYVVFDYIREHELLNYSDDYLLETIVPSIENHISYLKNFGILPQDIEKGKVVPFLKEMKSYSVDDLILFLDAFIAIYNQYESSKKQGTCDYADMLLQFLDQKNNEKTISKNEKPTKQFKYVLIDELQDVNRIEAEIALKVAENFFAVGDKKQAIFGFQGGSIKNFDLFSDATKFVLSENRRSTQNILDFAKTDYINRTQDETQKQDVKELRNSDNTKGEKVTVIESVKKEVPQLLAELCRAHIDESKEKSKEENKTKNKKIAVIARTNTQVASFSRYLSSQGIEHSSTSVQSSRDARKHLLVYLKGILSNDIEDVKACMFTPFFPSGIRTAFELAKEYELSLEKVFEVCPEFKKTRESIKTVNDIDLLFKNTLLPVASTCGKGYFLAIVQLQNLLVEAMDAVDSKQLMDVFSYINSADQTLDETAVEKDIVITTVHKSKGREYDHAIYVPSKTRNKQDFVKEIVHAVLCSKGIDASIELEEETLRIDFVAYTRARKKLVIIAENAHEYLNDFSEVKTVEATEESAQSTEERLRRAYSLFLQGNATDAGKLLHVESDWLNPFVEDYFTALKHVSFSGLPKENHSYEYLKNQVLHIRSYSKEMDFGNKVHKWAEDILDGKEVTDQHPTVENIKKIHSSILSSGFKVESVEDSFRVRLSDLTGEKTSLLFKGKIDAVYKKEDKYLIVDWKSSKKADSASEYRQQLEIYKRMFALKNNVPLENISVAIGFVALRNTINDGEINGFFDDKQPAKSSFNTVKKRIDRFLEWQQEPGVFLEELFSKPQEEHLWQALKEEFELGSE